MQPHVTLYVKMQPDVTTLCQNAIKLKEALHTFTMNRMSFKKPLKKQRSTQKQTKGTYVRLRALLIIRILTEQSNIASHYYKNALKTSHCVVKINQKSQSAFKISINKHVTLNSHYAVSKSTKCHILYFKIKE